MTVKEPLRVLILEDNPEDAEIMLFYLRRANFDPVWKRVDTGAAYLQECLHGEWNIILADYNLPQYSAIRALAAIKENKLNIPFIVVTGNVGEEEAVECMRKGAADYLLKDRLARLGEAVRHVLHERQISQEREVYQRQMLSAQKMADLGTLSAGVAHELNSPLQVIIGLSESLLDQMKQKELSPERLKLGLESISRNGWRCADIIRSLLSYSRPSSDFVQPNDLNELVKDSLLLIEHQLLSWSNITVKTELAEGLPLFESDRNRIIQVIINLLTNSRDAMPSGGTITIRTSFDEKQQRLLLSIADTGVGIPDEIKPRLFDPFFTTKPVGHGTGLGLAIVLGIVNLHGGEIQIDSQVRVGTTFTLSFPLTWQPKELGVQELPLIGLFDDPFLQGKKDLPSR